MSWIEVRSSFDSSLQDLSPFIDIYRDHGIENTLEEPHGLIGCLVSVDGAPDVLAKLVEALRNAGAVDVQTRDLPEENWDELWKRHFKPRKVGRSFLIRPSWEEYAVPPDEIEIVLDPGQAFGTGEHATTRMCLELLEDADVAGKTVLDLGCGSGILSVAAVKLGAESVVAIDIDPLAVEVTKENAELNGVSFEAREGDGLASMEPVQVLISNIISATLIRLSPDAFRLVLPRGQWMVSGIITQNWPDVLEAAQRAGFELVEHREDEGWVAARFTRR